MSNLQFLKQRDILALCMGYLSIYIIVYTFHGYSLNIIQEKLADDQKRYANLIMMILGLRFFGSFIWSLIADKTRMHRWLVGFSVVCYGCTYPLLSWARKRGLFTMAIVMVFSTFFNGGIFSNFDILVLNYIERKKIPPSKFGAIRSFGVIGQCLSNLIGSGVSKIFILLKHEQYYNNNLNIVKFINILFYFPILAAAIYFSPNFKFTEKPEKNEKKATVYENIKSISTLPPLFFLFIFTLLLFGVFRSSFSDVLSAYLKELKIKYDYIHFINFYRCILETVLLYLYSYLDIKLAVEPIYLISLLAGFTRALIYTLFSVENRFMLVLFCETFKGICAATLSLSDPLIAKKYTTPTNQSLVMGIRYGLYNGSAYFIVYLLLFFFETYDIKYRGSTKRLLFLCSNLCMVVAIVLHFIYMIVWNRKKKIHQLEEK